MNQFKDKEHVEFARWFTRNAIGSILAAMLCFGLCITAAQFELNVLSALFAAGFVGLGLYALVYLNYQLRRVSCPECSNMCTTEKDQKKRRWVALCHACKVRWNLGVGVKSTNNI